MRLGELKRKLESKEALLAVIGLGYVGLPVSAMFADCGFDVLGVEIRADRVQEINSGQNPIQGEEPGLSELIKHTTGSKKLRATNDYNDLKDRDVILIGVETPVNDQHIPEYNALRQVVKQLGPVLKDGALVIIESTIAPGTMSNLVCPLLEHYSGKKINQGFFLGNCPERVMPGKLITNLKKMSRVVGGEPLETALTMISLYKHIVQADLDATDWITAELVKTVENSYRDVQIAFANEVALICEQVEGDVWKVRDLVNKSPNRQMHLPGAGVGGHCIPKDPWLMVYSVQDKDLPLHVVPAARMVNNFMPFHMVDLVREGFLYTGVKFEKAKVLVMGYAYMEDSDDVRNSPSIALVKRFRELGTDVVIHDPYIAEFKGDLITLARNVDAVIVMVAHHYYKMLNLAKIRVVVRTPLLIDGRSVYTKTQAEQAGFKYIGLGKGSTHLDGDYV